MRCAARWLFVLAWAVLSAAHAQNYPTRPIRVVVPYTPGGITDVTTRIVAQELARNFGQNTLVDNRPGANSILGVEIVSKATPDGHTFTAKLPFDVIRDFAPGSAVGSP